MIILTLNCGSSSVKYQVYDWDNKSVLASGVVERVTQPGSVITHEARGKDKYVLESPCPTHTDAVQLIIKTLTHSSVGVITDMNVIKAVGHRVTHGGDKFIKSVIVTPEILNTFREGFRSAPQPCQYHGYRGCSEDFTECPALRDYRHGMASDDARDQLYVCYSA